MGTKIITAYWPTGGEKINFIGRKIIRGTRVFRRGEKEIFQKQPPTPCDCPWQPGRARRKRKISHVEHTPQRGHNRPTRVVRAVCRGEPPCTERDPTTIMTLSAVEISAYSAVGRRRQWRGIGDGGVVCNGRALSGSQTERRRAPRPSAPHDDETTTATATRQPIAFGGGRRRAPQKRDRRRDVWPDFNDRRRPNTLNKPLHAGTADHVNEMDGRASRTRFSGPSGEEKIVKKKNFSKATVGEEKNWDQGLCVKNTHRDAYHPFRRVVFQ